jgi:hypothetical protein
MTVAPALLFLAFAGASASVDPWPLPCADAGTCWLAWGRAERVTWYEVLSGDLFCARLDGYTDRRGRFREPRTVYWPRPGDGCWAAGASRSYQIIACNAAGCSPSRSDAVEFGPQEWRCFTPVGEVSCSS